MKLKFLPCYFILTLFLCPSVFSMWGGDDLICDSGNGELSKEENVDHLSGQLDQLDLLCDGEEVFDESVFEAATFGFSQTMTSEPKVEERGANSQEYSQRKGRSGDDSDLEEDGASALLPPEVQQKINAQAEEFNRKYDYLTSYFFRELSGGDYRNRIDIKHFYRHRHSRNSLNTLDNYINKFKSNTKKAHLIQVYFGNLDDIFLPSFWGERNRIAFLNKQTELHVDKKKCKGDTRIDVGDLAMYDYLAPPLQNAIQRSKEGDQLKVFEYLASEKKVTSDQKELRGQWPVLFSLMMAARNGHHMELLNQQTFILTDYRKEPNYTEMKTERTETQRTLAVKPAGDISDEHALTACLDTDLKSKLAGHLSDWLAPYFQSDQFPKRKIGSYVINLMQEYPLLPCYLRFPFSPVVIKENSPEQQTREKFSEWFRGVNTGEMIDAFLADVKSSKQELPDVSAKVFAAFVEVPILPLVAKILATLKNRGDAFDENKDLLFQWLKGLPENLSGHDSDHPFAVACFQLALVSYYLSEVEGGDDAGLLSEKFQKEVGLHEKFDKRKAMEQIPKIAPEILFAEWCKCELIGLLDKIDPKVKGLIQAEDDIFTEPARLEEERLEKEKQKLKLHAS